MNKFDKAKLLERIDQKVDELRAEIEAHKNDGKRAEREAERARLEQAARDHELAKMEMTVALRKKYPNYWLYRTATGLVLDDPDPASQQEEYHREMREWENAHPSPRVPAYSYSESQRDSEMREHRNTIAHLMASKATIELMAGPNITINTNDYLRRLLGIL